MKALNTVESKEELVEYIDYLAEDLKNRAEDISVDWNKRISNIEIKTKLIPGELLQWEVKKTYNAMDDEDR